jgi:hypothetical protein
MFSVPVRKQYPQRVASILFLPPSQPVNELNENGMSEDQSQGSASQSPWPLKKAQGSPPVKRIKNVESPQDMVALDFGGAAAWSRTMEELSQP